MRNKISVLFFLAFGLLSAENKEIDKLINEYIKTVELPSICISVSTSDSIIHKKAYGYSNLEKKTPATVDTIYPVGSISKSFTSVLFGIFQDSGLVSLDNKVSDLIPFFKLNNQAVTDDITIRDYLSHQSGYGPHDTLWYNQRYSRKELIGKLKHIEAIFPHRRAFSYQNIGYMVAGHALECMTGQTWEQLMQEKILDPLDMKNTYLDVLEIQKLDNFAFGYSDYNDTNQKVNYVDPYTIAPAAGVCTNINDLTKWMQLLQKNGDTLLDDSTFNELCSPQIVTDFLARKEFGLDTLIQMESYALGFFVITYQGKKIIFHSGNIEGFSSLIAFIPEEDIGVTIITNKNKSIAPFLIALSIFEKELDLEENNWLKKYTLFKEYEKDSVLASREHACGNRYRDSSPSHPLQEFTGTYHHLGYGDCVVRLIEDELSAVYNNMTFPLEHWHYDIFSTTKHCEHIQCKDVKFNFSASFSGNIEYVSILFEPENDAIVFSKQASKKLLTPEYLDRFIGDYKYCGVGFVIERQDDHIVVKTPGQAPFHLLPKKTLIFSVDKPKEGYNGYIVQFLENDEGEVHCVQMIQPNGSVFSAYKVNP